MMFDAEAVQWFQYAGEIVAKLRNEVPELVKPGNSALEICEIVEGRIKELGGMPAFPVGIGINDVAAHYTCPPGDKLVIPASSIVKVDFGVHMHGYVTDTAVTVCLEPSYEPLARAADEALTNAIRAFRPGVKLSDVGKIIQGTITRYGYRPIRNLTGHSIDRYSVHAGKSVPNIGEFNGARIIEGEVYAIEPFVTLPNAKGSVRDDPRAYIYRFVKTKGVKGEQEKQILALVRERFGNLPFAARWLQDAFPPDVIFSNLDRLIKSRCIMSYRVLVEESGMPVAQSEHTVLVGKDRTSVLTGRLAS